MARAHEVVASDGFMAQINPESSNYVEEKIAKKSR